MSRRQPIFTVFVAVLLLGGAVAPGVRAQEASLGTFEDVPIDHWAFITVEKLVRKYKVMAGFPDGTFKGGKTVSRYELAAALDQALARLEGRQGPVRPLSAADKTALAGAVGALGLPALRERVQKLEEETEALTEKGPGAVKVAGSMSTTWMDNTQDTANPYLKTGFGVDVTAAVDGISVFGAMGGDVPGATVGNKPATAGSDKPPGTTWNFNGAHITADLAETKVRTGVYAPEDFYDASTTLPAYFGGIIGNGFIGIGTSNVRWYDRNVTVAATRQFGPLSATVAASPAVILAGLDLKVNDYINLKLTGDSDQPDWSGLNPNRAVARNIYGVIDLGTDTLGLALQGGMAKSLISGSAMVSWKAFSEVRLSAGAVYTTSEKAVTEVTPGVSLFLPAIHKMAPSLLFGVKEPQVLEAAQGKAGPGSLLGEQAGVTVLAKWELEDVGLPNFKVEYNIQQPVLFYSIYDATFAFSAGRGF